MNVIAEASDMTVCGTTIYKRLLRSPRRQPPRPVACLQSADSHAGKRMACLSTRMSCLRSSAPGWRRRQRGAPRQRGPRVSWCPAGRRRRTPAQSAAHRSAPSPPPPRRPPPPPAVVQGCPGLEVQGLRESCRMDCRRPGTTHRCCAIAAMLGTLGLPCAAERAQTRNAGSVVNEISFQLTCRKRLGRPSAAAYSRISIVVMRACFRVGTNTMLD